MMLMFLLICLCFVLSYIMIYGLVYFFCLIFGLLFSSKLVLAIWGIGILAICLTKGKKDGRK